MRLYQITQLFGFICLHVVLTSAFNDSSIALQRKQVRRTMVNTTISTNFSPVILKESWSRSTRLIWLVILATIGCIGNIFKIASLIIDDHLRKKENYPIVNYTVSDFIMTSIVIPSSAFHLLSGIEPTIFTCKVQWFFIIFTFITNNISMAMAAVENYGRVTGSRSSEISSSTVFSLTFSLISISIAAALGQLNLGYDYCSRKAVGSTHLQLIISLLFIFVPMCIAFIMYVMAMTYVRNLRRRPNFRPSAKLLSDFYLTKSNFFCFGLFICMWIPFIVTFILSLTYIVTDELLYTTAWVGVVQSVLSPFIYCGTNNDFRDSFVRLFNYFFLKTNVGYSRRQRTQARAVRDVRVHIIPGYNLYNPPRRARNSTSSA